jgi:FKBP-type peptidyl-prolyl cis-trans isomerase
MKHFDLLQDDRVTVFVDGRLESGTVFATVRPRGRKVQVMLESGRVLFLPREAVVSVEIEVGEGNDQFPQTMIAVAQLNRSMRVLAHTINYSVKAFEDSSK